MVVSVAADILDRQQFLVCALQQAGFLFLLHHGVLGKHTHCNPIDVYAMTAEQPFHWCLGICGDVPILSDSLIEQVAIVAEQVHEKVSIESIVHDESAEQEAIATMLRVEGFFGPGDACWGRPHDLALPVSVSPHCKHVEEPQSRAVPFFVDLLLEMLGDIGSAVHSESQNVAPKGL